MKVPRYLMVFEYRINTISSTIKEGTPFLTSYSLYENLTKEESYRFYAWEVWK